MNYTQFVVSSQAKDMRQVRVFVRGLHNKYGECSERALQNARKHGTKVKVTFRKSPLQSSLETWDEYVPVNHVK